jgi:hypothetical protein
MIVFPLLLASVTLQVEVVEENRFKISTVIANPDSPNDQFNAQMGIVMKAKQVCKVLKRGDAVSEGVLHADSLPPAKGKKKGALKLTEFYSCRTL